ncbi:hypothetical protein N8T08_006858 [Aspergillus melleus]|uniref:Uncharacterized protein n=1 Tax=Aspergillus melleus TaxID=138277 RepID=A0ACC3B0A0_9EURO|nr:hypothetical protein N8T08_006858 [Aspergillus melleus]
MLAMFAGSTTSDPPDPGLNTSQELQNPEQQQQQQHQSPPPPHEPEISSPPPPPPPALSVSTPDDSLPRRIKSKSSLRSVRSFGSSLNDEDPSDETPEQPGSDKSLIRPSILRRLSPGLAARVKLLDGSHSKSAANSRSPGAVGRIPEEHIKELDTLHQNLSSSIKVEKKGRSWNALHLIGKDKKHQGGSSDLLEVIEPELLDVPVTESFEREALDELTLLPSETDAQLVEHAAAESLVTESIEPVDAVDTTTTTTTIETTETRNPPPAQPEAQPSPPAMSVAEPLPASTLPTPVETIPEPEPEPEPAAQEPTDFEKYIQSTSESQSDHPPPPPPKDSPPESDSNSAYFRPSSLHRADSIFSFSRASFSNQLSQLTSISLPQASSLASSIAAIPNAPSAVKSLTGAADQIQIWIKKATSVLEGLDADDDVEWAAAGGRDGLDDVDNAITTFEGLINVYVKAIEDVQLRPDIENVAPESLRTIVTQMDFIIQHWTQIKSRLRSVKSQVELAMEWEELWNNILGDVGAEVGNLAQLIFQMEEKRHLVMEGSQSPGSNGGVDINELETIVEETPGGGNRASKRLSVEPIFNVPPTLDTPIIQTPQEDNFHSDLIGLFARIQPLRASLDFLPMRLSMFQSRAEAVFPSACQDLQQGIERLEGRYKMLEMEAEDLRKELSEDRWILVFRNAGGQAQKMFQSVERSIAKLQEALESGAVYNNPAGLGKRIESYEAKKQHYVAAIERVVSIIQKGVKDRLTLNGETLTLLSDMTSKLDALKASIKVMDASLEDVHVARSQQLRDSISSIVTMDSPATGSVVDTPGSSPASSVVMTPANPRKGASTPLGSSRRGSSVSSAARTTMSKVRRYSGLPQATTTLTGKKSALPKPSFGSPTKTNGSTTPTPVGRKPVARPAAPPIPNRPRWNIATNTNDLDQYKPTPFRKSSAPNTTNGRTPRPSSTLPFSRSTRRDLSASPAPSAGRSASRVSSRLTSRSPAPPPSPSPGSSLLDPPPYSKLRRPAGAEHLVNTPRNRQSFAGMPFNRSVSQQYSNGLLSPTKADRPGTALGHSGSRRISLLPLPKGRSGRDSAAENRGKLAERPRWR